MSFKKQGEFVKSFPCFQMFAAGYSNNGMSSGKVKSSRLSQ
jgi:hypothetical protein